MRMLSRLLTLLLLAFPIFAQTDEDIISVDSTIVVMNAAVTDASGKAVEGLAVKHFRVFEEGVEQKVEIFETAETPFAAVILIDTSGSMEERVALARAAAIQFLGAIRASDSVAIYRFDSKVDLVQDFSNNRDMSDRVFDLKADGMTVLNDAVFKAAQLLSPRPERRRAIIVLSDGADTMSKKSADKALKAALKADATIYTVDMSPMQASPGGVAQNRGVLKNFAEKTGGRFIATPGGVAMREAFTRIASELGAQYTIGYEPTNTNRDGRWRSIELRVTRPNLTVRTRKGYNAPKEK